MNSRAEYRSVGARWRNCGATGAQKEIGDEQMNFLKTLNTSFGTTFANQQNILNNLTASFAPIVAAGPNQTGFSPAESAALHTGSQDTVTQEYKNAQIATQNNAETAGGGDESLGSGAEAQLKAANASGAAAEGSKESSEITQADYATGRQNYFAASQGLSGVAAAENPEGFGGLSVGEGNAAENTQKDISSENDAWMQALGGALGGAVGGWASGGFKH
jgi:hypothetical protein